MPGLGVHKLFSKVQRRVEFVVQRLRFVESEISSSIIIKQLLLWVFFFIKKRKPIMIYGKRKSKTATTSLIPAAGAALCSGGLPASAETYVAQNFTLKPRSLTLCHDISWFHSGVYLLFQSHHGIM